EAPHAYSEPGRLIKRERTRSWDLESAVDVAKTAPEACNMKTARYLFRCCGSLLLFSLSSCWFEEPFLDFCGEFEKIPPVEEIDQGVSVVFETPWDNCCSTWIRLCSESGWPVHQSGAKPGTSRLRQSSHSNIEWLAYELRR